MGSRYVPDHCSVYTQNTTNTPLTKQGATFYMDKQHNRLGIIGSTGNHDTYASSQKEFVELID